MKKGNKIVTFRVFKGEDGYYVATNETFGIFTQGKTLKKLLGNILEATETALEEIFDISPGERSPEIVL